MMTINLPVGTIQTIINIDDSKLEIPIEEAYEYMKEDDDKYIRTLDTNYNIVEQDINDRIWKVVEMETNTSFINKIRKQDIVNNPNMKYFKATIRFWNDKEVEMIVPSYVKFFSKISKQFIPIEFIGKADILYDYQGRYAMVKHCEEIDFKPTEYYNMYINNSNDSQSGFYYNGIYSYVYYINFFRDPNKEKEDK